MLTHESVLLTTSVGIPAGTTFEYKYIRIVNETVTWEFDPNRSFTTGTIATSINDTWSGPAA